MTERANFKKPAKVEPKPFQVSLDFKTGLKIGAGIVIAQIVVALAQVAVSALMTYVMIQ